MLQCKKGHYQWESCFHTGRCDLLIIPLAVSISSLSVIIPLCIYSHDWLSTTLFLSSSMTDQIELGDCRTRPHFHSSPRPQTQNQNASLPLWMPWKQERVLKDPLGECGNTDRSHLLESAHNGTLPSCPHCTFIHHCLWVEFEHTIWGWMLPLWAHEGGFPSRCSNMICTYLQKQWFDQNSTRHSMFERMRLFKPLLLIIAQGANLLKINQKCLLWQWNGMLFLSL